MIPWLPDGCDRDRDEVWNPSWRGRRGDDRGDPVAQLSPPLVAEQAEFDESARILGRTLQEAGGRMEVTR